MLSGEQGGGGGGGGGGEQGGGARHKEVSGLQCLWAERQALCQGQQAPARVVDPPAQGDHSGRGRAEGSGSEKEMGRDPCAPE